MTTWLYRKEGERFVIFHNAEVGEKAIAVTAGSYAQSEDKAKLLTAAPHLRDALAALLAAAPAFRAMPEGAPGSEARARQDAHIAAEDMARAALDLVRP